VGLHKPGLALQQQLRVAGVRAWPRPPGRLAPRPAWIAFSACRRDLGRARSHLTCLAYSFFPAPGAASHTKLAARPTHTVLPGQAGAVVAPASSSTDTGAASATTGGAGGTNNGAANGAGNGLAKTDYGALAKSDYAKFVQFFRQASPYIEGHRGRTFVIVIPGEVRRAAGQRGRGRASCRAGAAGGPGAEGAHARPGPHCSCRVK
jgi:hypothetical protein